MATYLKDSVFLWVSAIFILLVNLGVMISIYLFQPPLLKQLSQPLIISIFLVETYQLATHDTVETKLKETGQMIRALFFIFLVILEIFLFKSKNDNDAKETQENNDNETNEDNESSPNDKKVDFNNFDFNTAIFALVMWLTYMMYGVYSFNGMKGTGNEYALQYFFHLVFMMATLQFVYGMYIINQNVSKLLYLIYMAPQAILFPLSAIISYYVDQKDDSAMKECYGIFSQFMSAILLFAIFKNFNDQCPNYTKDDKKNKGLYFIFILIGLFWYSLVDMLQNISNDYEE